MKYILLIICALMSACTTVPMIEVHPTPTHHGHSLPLDDIGMIEIDNCGG